MTVRSNKTGFGGTDYTFGETPISSADQNDTNDAIIDRMCPIGSIVAWAKSFTSVPQTLPDGWVLCDGSAISDSDSPMDGETVPDLNGDNRFLRGETTSGGTGGSETHTHGITASGSGAGGDDTLAAASTLPTYYEVVWIFRIK